MTLLEILKYIASPIGMGALAVVITHTIRKVWPMIDEQYAVVASFLVSLVLGLAAQTLIPYTGGLPPWFNDYWPLIYWAASQLWYWLLKWLGLYKAPGPYW